MPRAYQHLRVRLRIEQTRLLNWGQKIGLVEELLSEPNRTLEQNRVLVMDLLFAIQALFRECIVVEAKHNRLLSSRWSGRSRDGPDQDVFDERFPKATDSLLQKTLGFLEKTSEVPERLLWSMVKKEKFEDLVKKLIDYNSSIEALLDSASISQLQHIQHHTYLALLQLNTSVAELKEVSGALKIKARATPDGTDDAESEDLVKKGTTQGVDIARLAEFKAQQIQVENQSAPEAEITPLQPKDVTVTASAGSRSVAKYQGKTVWIEWKYSNVDFGLHPKWKAMIEDRIKKLMLLLRPPNKPLEFNAPQCLGYFYDEQDTEDDAEDRFGFLYSHPSHSSPHATPSSLLELIKAQRQRGHPPPSLTKRIRLAHSIARSVLYIHSVNWIHKGLRSDNIIFFVSEDQEPDLARPPLIAGFEYARPDLPEEETEHPPEHSENDIYRRPATTRSPTRSQKSHDIYSLGIILVEIAYWRPISEIMKVPGANETAARARVKQVRQLLLQPSGPYLATVDGAMGESYTEAVRRCIEGGSALGIPENADESDVHVGVRLQETFVLQVVDKLGNVKT